MAQSTITYLTDDLDGSEAVETVRFGLDGKSYDIDLSKANAALLRRALRKYISNGRSAGRSGSTGRGRPAGRRRSSSKSGGKITAFSKLNAEEKDRFRKWAKLPVARRIADARVQEWVKAGKP